MLACPSRTTVSGDDLGRIKSDDLTRSSNGKQSLLDLHSEAVRE